LAVSCRGAARRAVALLAIAALLGACRGETRRAPPATYVVRPGDTLYAISWRHGLDYHEVAQLNGIGPDYRIDVGQVLRLAAGVTVPAPASAHAGPAAPAPPAVAAFPAPLPVTPAPHWLWPADGRAGPTVRQPNGGLGLEIQGSAGAEVRAAAAGRVVYTGAGLRGYGSLVIIKHDEAWLSAYGYNRELAVREGDNVRAGQRIAAMGEAPSHRPALYFEIRLNGRPVDPASALPRR
jgi:lipoprotein NlpD